jgi:hypothetical protein
MLNRIVYGLLAAVVLFVIAPGCRKNDVLESSKPLSFA